jgi:hypothetical protein
MRLQKIINLFKQIDTFAGKEEIAFIEFLTEKIPTLWDEFLTKKEERFDNTDMSDAD